MEIILVDNSDFSAARFTSSETLLKCSVPNHYPRVVRGNQSHAQYLKKVLAASEGKEYCIHIKRSPDNPDESKKCLVRLHDGFFSENFETLWMKDLKVRIQLSFAINSPAMRLLFPLQMFAEIPIPKPSEKSSATVDSVNETCITNGVFLEATDVSVNYWHYLFYPNLGNNPEILGSAAITLLSDSNDLHVNGNFSRGLARVTRGILESGLSSDVIISDKSGSEHNCIKAFLTVQSGVFKAMLETDMMESKTNRIEMNDMSSDGVKALLEYLYTSELDQAIENCDIALELLEAGHKYDIESLEKDVSSLILNKDEEWFSADMAFNLFLFTRKVESMKDVKMKVASVLIKFKKSKEFMECKAYMKEREENIVVALDAVQELFGISALK